MTLVHLKSLVIISCVSLSMPELSGAEMATEPVLRLEVEQHTATINRLDVDRAERFVVTGSEDKTARVWSLPEGKLLTVLRPPIGPGNQGKVYAVAISPDGSTVAVGGWMSSVEDGKLIYLFDRQTGRILHRFTGLESVVHHLTFSPDGRYLAAGLGANGIRVWRMADRELVLRDPDYKETVYRLAFALDGRLAATSFDGYVRLYSAQFKALARERAPGGTKPSGVAFSPDGRQLAIGYGRTAKVSVLSATTLRQKFEPDTTGIVGVGDGGDLATVTWSADGQFLYAGGTYQERSGVLPVFRWADGGRGTRTILSAAQSTLMDLKPYGRSGVLFVAADPAFGAFNGQGQAVLTKGPEIPDLRNKLGRTFTVSPDGTTVRFGLEYGARKPVQFDLTDRQVRQDWQIFERDFSFDVLAQGLRELAFFATSDL